MKATSVSVTNVLQKMQRPTKSHISTTDGNYNKEKS